MFMGESAGFAGDFFGYVVSVGRTWPTRSDPKSSCAGWQRRPSAENARGRMSKKGAAKQPLLVVASVQAKMFGDRLPVVVVEALGDIVGEKTGDQGAADFIESLHSAGESATPLRTRAGFH